MLARDCNTDFRLIDRVTEIGLPDLHGSHLPTTRSSKHQFAASLLQRGLRVSSLPSVTAAVVGCCTVQISARPLLTSGQYFLRIACARMRGCEKLASKLSATSLLSVLGHVRRDHVNTLALCA
jgi:hypothetical protein